MQLCLLADFALFRINYALYEELDAEDMERTRDVYRLDIVVSIEISLCSSFG